MVSFFEYLLISIGGLILGAMVFLVLYTFWDLLNKWRLKKNLRKENLANPGAPPEINEKEELENERRRIEKFREFEKLRRSNIKARSRRAKESASFLQREGIDARHDILPPSHDFIPPDDSRKSESNECEPEQSNRKIKLHRPSDS